MTVGIKNNVEWIEANIKFLENTPNIWTYSQHGSLHIDEESLTWGGIKFTKLVAIGTNHYFYQLERNGEVLYLNTDQGKRVFK